MERCDCLDRCGDDERVAKGKVAKCERYDLEQFRRWQHCTAPRMAACMTPASVDVLEERKRQVDVEGWTPQHDDEHSDGEMPHAAACYALMAGGTFAIDALWPKIWGPVKAKPQRRALVIAAALLLAEIERLDRAQKP